MSQPVKDDTSKTPDSLASKAKGWLLGGCLLIFGSGFLWMLAYDDVAEFFTWKDFNSRSHVATFSHGLALKVRHPDEVKFTSTTNQYGLEIYYDTQSQDDQGNRAIYLSVTGHIAVPTE